MKIKDKIQAAAAICTGVVSAVLMAGCCGGYRLEKQNDFSAREWLDRVTVGWCLGNQFEAYTDLDDDISNLPSHPFAPSTTEASWNNPAVTRAAIDSVRAAGFDAVRIPVRWYPHASYEDGVTTIDPEWIRRIREVVDWCLEDGMLVVINTHHEKWLEEHLSPEDQQFTLPRFGSLWTAIAQAFADYDGRVAFAGMCEMRSDDADFVTPATLAKARAANAAMQSFVDAVRSAGGNNASRVLWVQTYAAEPYNNVPLLKLPIDSAEDRLVVEVHSYVPFLYALGPLPAFGKDFSHLNGPMLEAMAASGYDVREGAEDLQTMTISDEAHARVVERLRQTLLAEGIPVVIGEFGSTRKDGMNMNDPCNALLQSRIHYYVDMLRLCCEAGIKVFMWDNGYIADQPDVRVYFFDRWHDWHLTDPLTVSAIMAQVSQNS